MLTSTQVQSLKSLGLFSLERYQVTLERDQAPSYSALEWLSRAIFGDDDDDLEENFDVILDAFESRFPAEDFEIACICLDCA